MSKYMKFIQESYEKMKQFSLYDTPIVIKDPFVEDIDMAMVVRNIASIIPAPLLEGLDIIYVGNFQELEEKEVSALYLNGAIYISNLQTSEEDFVENMIHEIAHFVEEKFTNNIYGTNHIEREFLKKRNILFDILEDKGYEVPVKFRHTIEYNRVIDDYFYKFVGYPKLRDMTAGLFLSAYSVTDIREYFAISFENYFGGNKEEVREITPNVYLVLEDLLGE